MQRNIRRTLRMVLEGEGATVLDAETAEAGLKLIEQSLADGAEGRPGYRRGRDGRCAAAGYVGVASSHVSLLSVKTLEIGLIALFALVIASALYALAIWAAPAVMRLAV